MAFLFLAQCLN